MPRLITSALGVALLCGMAWTAGGAAAVAAGQAPAQPSAPAPPPSKSVAKGGRVFEMRTYYAAPGKAEDLNARFREHTMRLFEKHGITNIGYWIPKEKPDTIVYILAYPSDAARQDSWKAFREDPDWQKAAKASEANGKLVLKVDSVILDPTDYSQIK